MEGRNEQVEVPIMKMQWREVRVHREGHAIFDQF